MHNSLNYLATKMSTIAKSFQWVNNPTPLTKVPSDFTLPEDMRPHFSETSSLPVIDLRATGEDDPFPPEVVDQLTNACEEYGCFQIVNHGVPEDLCDTMLEAVRELMESPPETKAELYSEGAWQDGRIFRRHVKTTSAAGDEENQGKVMMWSEQFRHSWHPTDDFSAVLPKHPLRYREVMLEYSKEMGKLFSRLLSLMSLSLGLNKDCIHKIHGSRLSLRAQANYYPPCPNPDVTLGLGAHTDISTLTVLRQTPGICGLQVMISNKWVLVEPVSNSFTINLGDQLQVMSNDRYKSVVHRAVVSKDKLRVSVAMFYRPGDEVVVGPIEELLDDDHPPVYRKYLFKEFQEVHDTQIGMKERIKEAFQIDAASLR